MSAGCCPEFLWLCLPAQCLVTGLSQCEAARGFWFDALAVLYLT